MAVLKNFNENELCINCNCGCDEGMHIKIDKYDKSHYAFLSCTNGKFYYADICMTENEFHQFKAWINRH